MNDKANGTRPACHRQSGFSLVTAIFLMVVLAGLGIFIASISMMQHTSSALDVEGSRAFQAARAGIEWGLHRQLQSGSCVAASTSFSFPAASQLNGFTVTVTCMATAYAGASPAITTRQIRATACNQPLAVEPKCPGAAGGTYYIERQLQVTL